MDTSRVSAGRAAAHAPLPSGRQPPSAAAPRAEGPAVSMGRGASRGREIRDVQIVTRPSGEFSKLGNHIAYTFLMTVVIFTLFSSCRQIRNADPGDGKLFQTGKTT